MQGYVTVIFNESSPEYTYMVPDYVDFDNIQTYVIVENVFYNKTIDVSPYKIVKVTGLYSPWEKPTDKKVTKYIVDIIDSEKYKENRRNQEYKNKLDEKLTSYFDALPLEDKTAILMAVLAPEEMDKIVY